MKVISSSSSTIQITWINRQTSSDDQTSAGTTVTNAAEVSSLLSIASYLLYFKLQNGENVGWQELRLPGGRSSYLFENLRCGSRYQFYMVAVNAVDKSDPSEVITAKTDGMGTLGTNFGESCNLEYLFFFSCTAPVAPDKHSLLVINSSAVVIQLDSWHDGGCSINRFEIMYKNQRVKKWINLPWNENDLDFKRLFITNLKPSTAYDLTITAMNDAGPTQAQYTFSTFAILRGKRTLVHSFVSQSK